MRWIVHSEKPLYTDPWLDIRVADVELPDGRHLEHRLIRTAPGAGVVVTDQNGRALLLWRHRFITDTWGWEIPIGKADPGEDPALAAAKSRREQAGGPGRCARCCGSSRLRISDSVHHLYRADSATQIGAPKDDFESSRIDWVPLGAVPGLISRGEITSGTTLAATPTARPDQPGEKPRQHKRRHPSSRRPLVTTLTGLGLDAPGCESVAQFRLRAGV